MTWKKLVLSLVWGLAILAWAALFAYQGTDPMIKDWTIAVTGVAILTEIAFWATAAILGLTILESRKRVFGFLSRPMRRKQGRG
ncbi:MAG: hypothetical protein ABJG15_09845 [Hyphomonadaceae bacterium]